MKNTKDVIFENLKSEIEDDYSDDSLFNIFSWGADLSFREIIAMYDENELVKPELQRKYVWDKNEASRFIESLLMGLPVPSVFFAKSGSQKLIVDGYQRIMTVYDYVNKGIFSGDGKIFKLSNSEKINQRWRNKAFSELSIDDQRKIKSTTIHAIIFEQKKPENDDTSLYQIFERINTSGRTLTPQEIRNCVYQGSFNQMLFELNENIYWRKLFGSIIPDSRMKDLECILRFFVMKSDMVQKNNAKQISLKKFLNDYMGQNRNITQEQVDIFKNEFITCMEFIYKKIGDDAFRNYTNGKYSSKFNPALFDAISVSFNNMITVGKINNDRIISRHHMLFDNEEFSKACKYRTTDTENIKKRISLAEKILFGDNEEDEH